MRERGIRGACGREEGSAEPGGGGDIRNAVDADAFGEEVFG